MPNPGSEATSTKPQSNKGSTLGVPTEDNPTSVPESVPTSMSTPRRRPRNNDDAATTKRKVGFRNSVWVLKPIDTLAQSQIPSESEGADSASGTGAGSGPDLSGWQSLTNSQSSSAASPEGDAASPGSTRDSAAHHDDGNDNDNDDETQFATTSEPHVYRRGSSPIVFTVKRTTLRTNDDDHDDEGDASVKEGEEQHRDEEARIAHEDFLTRRKKFTERFPKKPSGDEESELSVDSTDFEEK
jgi:hypothetical protein